MKRYAKALVAASGVLVAVGEALADGAVDQGDVLQIIGAIAVAYGVYRVPNKQPAA